MVQEGRQHAAVQPVVQFGQRLLPARHAQVQPARLEDSGRKIGVNSGQRAATRRTCAATCTELKPDAKR
jgi:hypothetical protein